MSTDDHGRQDGHLQDSSDGNALADSSAGLSAAFAMRTDLPAALFDPDARTRLQARVDIRLDAPITDFDDVDPAVLADLDLLVTGWGCPLIDAAVLDRMPRLRAVFHAAGTVKHHLTPAVWERGIRVTTAAAANAYPVAEYTVGMILLAGKGLLPTPPIAFTDDELATIGNYRRTVGIVGASTVGRQVVRLLDPFDFRILLFDPVIRDDDPILARTTRVDLDTLLRQSTIVSVHAPLLPSTIGMIGHDEIALLAPGTTVINTARAPIVDQNALTAAVRDRGIRAILDVTDPEPLPVDHELRSLPGVLVTPHVAGALGNELHRLGESVVREVDLFARGLHAAYPVRTEDLAAMA